MFYKGKKFDHHLVEKDVYDFWKNHHYFEPKHYQNDGKNFSIILPPPNITGHLHLGHAWDGSIQDVIIRYKKLQGFNTCWLPGTDHAGIATQTKFDKVVKEKQQKFSNQQEYLKALDIWASEQKSFIHSQWAKMGFALSYSNETYTLDDNVKELVNQVFLKLYEQGLIYQAYKLTNWDVQLKSAISDIEVIHKPTQGKMYYFKYYLKNNPKEYLTVATTRPETMFGDTHVFINPNDQKHIKYLNQTVINPVNGMELPILADEYVELGFGTGVMKCTPAHDFNDYNLAIKHNITNYHSIMNDDGTLTSECVIKNKSYSGMDRLVARPLIVKQLEELGLVVKIENHQHEIGYSERTNQVIEPLLSKQWFVKMQPIVEQLNQTIKSGEKVDFIPSRFAKTIQRWLDNINDWCISRQLLWGHKIPVYYGPNNEMYVGLNPPQGYKQDTCVLDTWFSSGLWPLATTIHNANHDCSCFYPVNVLATAYDILFFWVARMLFQCNNLSNTIPLKTVLVHGLIRDEQNRKMSKSLGNGIEPNDVIDQYGSDALRIFLISSSTMGEDLRYSNEKIVYMTNFLNKLWNVHNLLELHHDYQEVKTIKHPINLWLINEFNSFINKITKLYDEYNYSVLVNTLIDFIWNTYCNTYLELIHPLLNTNERNECLSVANLIFKKILVVLHPICPFITETLYQTVKEHQTSIMDERFPAEINVQDKQKYSSLMNILIPIISKIRELRIKQNIKNVNVIKVNLINSELTKNIDLVKSIAQVYNIEVLNVSDKPVNQEFEVISTNNSIIEYLNDFTDLSKKKEELTKRLKFLEDEIKRSEGILNNKNFIAKAPKEKVKLEQDKYAKYLEDYQTTKKILEQ